MKRLYLLIVVMAPLLMSCERMQQVIIPPTPANETIIHTHKHFHTHKHSPEHDHDHTHEHYHLDDLFHDFTEKLDHSHEIDCIEHHEFAFDTHSEHEAEACLKEANELLSLETLILQTNQKTVEQIINNE